jgi:D-arabinose 1-dehydrogenase-like Zn-dependent alcohol dehydrogenase
MGGSAPAPTPKNIAIAGLGGVAGQGYLAAKKAQEMINAPQEEARRQAAALAAQQLAQAEEQRKMFEDRQKSESEAAAKTESTETARQQQKKKSLAATGRQGTILTSPLGVTAPAQKAGKTILGS